MRLMKRYSFVCILSIGLTCYAPAKNSMPYRSLKNLPVAIPHVRYIIWDLGSTLTHISHVAIARELGTRHIISMFWHIGKPKKMRQMMFEALESYGGKQTVTHETDIFTYDESGMPLPHFMSDTWLCSRIPNHEIIMEIKKAVDQWKPDLDISKAQKELIKKTLLIALSAHILGKHTCCIPRMLDLVKLCAYKGYPQYILSNFEKDAFEKAYVNPQNREIFRYFPRENIVISGECGMIKPHRCIYTYFLEKYNLDPASCLLIDDRPENIVMARTCGMQAILIKKGKYRRFARQLEKIIGN